MSNTPQFPDRNQSPVGDAASLAAVAAALWPIAAFPFREVGTIGRLMEKGLPPDAWLNSCGVYAVVAPPDYGFHLRDQASVRAANNVLSPLSNDRLESKWVKGARVVYIGFAGNTNPRTLRQRLKDLVRHGAGETTDRGPHRGGESIWQLIGYESFSIMALTTDLPPAPKNLEQSLLDRFQKRFGTLPFANRPAIEPEKPRALTTAAPVASASAYAPPPAAPAPQRPAVGMPAAAAPAMPAAAPAPQPSALPPLTSITAASLLSAASPASRPAGEGKSALSEAIDRALAQAQSAIVMDALHAAPDSMTIGDLVRSLKEHGLGDVFLGLTLGALRGTGGRAASAEKLPVVETDDFADDGDYDDENENDDLGGPVERSTRTRAGREAIDVAIRALLAQSGSMRAEDIRHEIGGTPTQVRDSLKRLVQENVVRVEGQKRATVYIWIGEGNG